MPRPSQLWRPKETKQRNLRVMVCDIPKFKIISKCQLIVYLVGKVFFYWKFKSVTLNFHQGSKISAGQSCRYLIFYPFLIFSAKTRFLTKLFEKKMSSIFLIWSAATTEAAAGFVIHDIDSLLFHLL